MAEMEKVTIGVIGGINDRITASEDSGRCAMPNHVTMGIIRKIITGIIIVCASLIVLQAEPMAANTDEINKKPNVK